MVIHTMSILATLALSASAAAQYSNTTIINYPSATTSGYPTSSPLPGTCEYLDNLCRVGPNANQAQCSAELAACKATTNCAGLRDVCRGQPDANQAFCAAQEAACNDRSTTATADIVVYTTVCPATSYHTSGTKTFTSTYTTTSTITSCKSGCPTPSAKPDCEKVRSDCQSKPDANQASCAALYVQCAGTTSGLNKPPAETTQDTTVYTTICPVTSYSTEGTKTRTSVYTTTSTITSCKGGCPSTYVPKPTSTPIDNCQDQFNKCRIGPDANQSFCAAEFAKCKGTFNYGTASASSSAPAQTQSATTYPASTLATTPAGTAPGAPAATTPSVVVINSASILNAGYMGLAGVAVVGLLM